MSIAIIDYGAGNLRSVEKGFQAVGAQAEITKDATFIRSAKGIVLPGVGSFDAALTELRNLGLEKLIEEAIALNKPFLGICLGMQHLFDSSEEGKLKGLQILKGKVVRFKTSTLSVPHMGWNRLQVKHKSPIFDGLEEGAMMYFAHSYYVVPEDETIVAAQTDYGINFCSSIRKGNLFGIQFHPEKSGENGLKILNNFAKLCS
ncbi:MAG: imidazole glycerol phosphate synthase subunit HisH [Candidatus Margulisiibacteriota bacterium]